MAITTYTELQSAIGNWLDHSLFTARIPEFITLFEATANRRLRVREQETSTSLTVTSGTATLPTDYLGWRRATMASSPKIELEYVEPSYLQWAFPSNTGGDPLVFTIEASSIYIRPVTSDNLTFLYYAKVPALSDSNPTNWLLTAHPDLYLFGSMVEAELFGVNDSRAPLWKARRDEIFDEIERLATKSRGIGAVRVMGWTP
jgi:hypothetical protein